MSSNSKSVVNFSGQIHLGLVTAADGQPTIQLSGRPENVSGTGISVSGSNLNPISSSDAGLSVVQATSFNISTINANTVNLTQTVISNVTDFNEVFDRLNSSPLQHDETLRNMITEFRDRIPTETPEQGRSRLKQIDDQLKGYQGIRELIVAAATRVFTGCLKLTS